MPTTYNEIVIDALQKLAAGTITITSSPGGLVTVAGVNGTTVATAANPLPVNVPGNGGVATVYANQQAVTASAVALTTRALTNGIVIKAKSTNAGTVFVGASGVTATDDGSGNGFALRPGESINLSISTTAGIFIIGTLNDIVYVIGN